MVKKQPYFHLTLLDIKTSSLHFGQKGYIYDLLDMCSLITGYSYIKIIFTSMFVQIHLVYIVYRMLLSSEFFNLLCFTCCMLLLYICYVH